MRVDKVSSRFSDWILSGMLCSISDIVSENSTQKVDFLDDVIIDIGEKTTLEAINRPTIQIVNSSTPNWGKAEKEIKASLEWRSIQVGEPIEIEFIIEDLINQSSVRDTMEWVYDLFLNNADNALLSCSLIHALSHLEYELIYPQGPMMAMAMFGAKDKRIVGFAIKAFSNWNSKDSLKYLNCFRPKEKWAEKEINRVIQYIMENGDDLYGVFNEENHTTKVDTRTA